MTKHITVEEAAQEFLETHAENISLYPTSSHARYRSNRIQLNWLADAFKSQRQEALKPYIPVILAAVESHKDCPCRISGSETYCHHPAVCNTVTALSPEDIKALEE